ncbi:uncharacterized protein LOC135694980 [Rhopilema esculentum]|uniref:uncharacterized protein LOC135694980 n=1 Tax=Rhopilema esculentum TaxID=499914 RepID=UPI0031CFC6AC
MKNTSYNVYVHLDQSDGEILYSKGMCKAGQSGCCKHVAALLFTLLDFTNAQYSKIPDMLTCTQVAQKWHVPSATSMTLSAAGKFDDVIFSKYEPNKEKKRAFASQASQDDCATPQFAQKVSANAFKQLANDLSDAGRATFLCKTLQSNDFKPTEFFETSCRKQESRVRGQTEQSTSEDAIILNIFENINSENTPPFHQSVMKEEIRLSVQKLVRVSRNQAIDICIATQRQAKDPAWFDERCKRVTASHFRKNIWPKAIINSITRARATEKENLPAPLKWGIVYEDVAITRYIESKRLDGNFQIKKCGFIINTAIPWLGCSPDGVVLRDNVPAGCIEVKCPFTKREMTLASASEEKSFFLKPGSNGLQLKKRHNYFYQCQGILNIINLPWIDFVVFTNLDLHVERIYKDTELWQNTMLPEVTDFYCNYIFKD